MFHSSISQSSAKLEFSLARAEGKQHIIQTNEGILSINICDHSIYSRVGETPRCLAYFDRQENWKKQRGYLGSRIRVLCRSKLPTSLGEASCDRLKSANSYQISGDLIYLEFSWLLRGEKFCRCKGRPHGSHWTNLAGCDQPTHAATSALQRLFYPRKRKHFLLPGIWDMRGFWMHLNPKTNMAEIQAEQVTYIFVRATEILGRCTCLSRQH